MRLVNMTPHTVDIYNESEELVVSLPSEGTIRLTTDMVSGSDIIVEEGVVPTYKTTIGTPSAGLPLTQSDTFYIVSGMVRAACPNRGDFYQPGRLLRDADGKPIGCVGLSR